MRNHNMPDVSYVPGVRMPDVRTCSTGNGNNHGFVILNKPSLNINVLLILELIQDNTIVLSAVEHKCLNRHVYFWNLVINTVSARNIF